MEDVATCNKFKNNKGSSSVGFYVAYCTVAEFRKRKKITHHHYSLNINHQWFMLYIQCFERKRCDGGIC